jgi:hypothetical protein
MYNQVSGIFFSLLTFDFNISSLYTDPWLYLVYNTTVSFHNWTEISPYVFEIFTTENEVSEILVFDFKCNQHCYKVLYTSES